MIEQFIITVLVIYGIKASIGKDMIFEFVYDFVMDMVLRATWGNRVLPYILKPLFDCTPCMASVYGTLSFVLFGSFPDPLVLSWIVWVFALSGFNYIVNKVIKQL